MQRVIENFPEFKKGQRNTTKHFNILDELKRLIEGRNLYKVSEVEQDLVTSSDTTKKNQLYKRVVEVMEDQSVSKMEKLRILLLFALRFENDNMVY